MLPNFRARTPFVKVKQADLGSVIKLGTGRLLADDAVPNFFIRSGQKAFTFCIQYRIGRQQRRSGDA